MYSYLQYGVYVLRNNLKFSENMLISSMPLLRLYSEYESTASSQLPYRLQTGGTPGFVQRQ